MISSKPLFCLTVEEFVEALREGLGLSDSSPAEFENSTPSDEKKRYVYGLKGLCSLLGCSLSTANRIKKSGAIDAAISQKGKIIIVDADLVLDILNVQKKKSRGNRKGYRIKK